ncbi:hypothetical protein VTK56DRAFT_9288 [Thermocarpiscus australiensis]
MASFSRGLGPRVLFFIRQQAPCQCAASQARLVLRAHFLPTSSRFFRQTAARSSRPAATAAAKPAAPKQPKNAPSKPSTLPGSAASQARRPSTYAEQLALKGRTVLYEAPSHFWFRAGCFSSGAFCVSYTVFQYWNIYISPPEGLYWWIPHAYGLILVAMAGMGAYFVLGAGRIVRSIEAVPASAVAKKLARQAAAAPGYQQSSPIYVEVATRRAFPLLPAKKTLLLPEEVQLPFRMYGVFGGTPGVAQRPVSLVEAVRAERAQREAKIAARKYTMDHLLTAPFRDAAKAFGTAFAGIKRSFYREGFAKIRLGKQTYKLDVAGGWALDNGRALDRLLPVRPNALR